jgi:integrase
MLAQHKLASLNTTPRDFVFASRSGRALIQRNVMRALRCAQRGAVDEHGRPTFPALHETDARGRRVPPPRGSVPSYHSFRHTAASVAIADGESAEEVSWQLGHKNSTVTRAIYIQEIHSHERSARRRARLESQYSEIIGAAGRSSSRRSRGALGST